MNPSHSGEITISGVQLVLWAPGVVTGGEQLSTLGNTVSGVQHQLWAPSVVTGGEPLPLPP